MQLINIRNVLLLFSVFAITNELAQGQKTYSSSYDGSQLPEFAVDGDKDTCAKTGSDATPWWSVDLGADHVVNEIHINTG